MNEILHSWMPILLAASWQAAFLVLAVFVITWLMGNRLSASWQRVLWLIPVLRFVVLIVPASNLSVFQMLPSFERWQPEPPPLASVATSSDGAAVNTLASRSAADDRSSVSGQQASFSHNPNSEPVQTQPKDKLVYSQTDHMDASESSSGEAEEPWSFRPMLIFASIWIAGTSFFLLRYAAVCFSLLRLVRRAQTGQDNTTLILIDRLKSQIGIKRSVQILYSDKIISPATTGILRPVILLPSVDSSRLHAEDLEMVLTHELMHIKRFDLAWILVANLAHALHWFNPLVYLAVDRLKQAMEAAADERAIHHLGTERLESYVELLMRLAAPPSSPSSALLAIASRRQQIKNRLERLVDGKPFSIWNWGLGAVIAILLVATGMTTGYVTGGSPQPQPVATNPVSQFSLQEDLTESNVVERKEDENVLRGKVLDHKGEPLPGAIVASQHVDEGLKELQALCNANGEFELRLPSKQKFNGIESYLSAFKPGYPLRTMNVAAHIWERRNEEQRAIEIRLPEQQSYEIRIEKANGEPLAHQEVWLENVQFPNGVSVADKPTGLTGPLPNLLKEQTKPEGQGEYDVVAWVIFNKTDYVNKGYLEDL
ncbi:MAG: M56 family metallopeptidase, partial [Planctomycetota bacterium]